ncbi:MAG: 3-dehydroquinate synthase [Clostridia bacterium]
MDACVRVALEQNSYDLLLGRGGLTDAGAAILRATRARRALLLTDSNVGPLYAPCVESSLARSGIASTRLTLPAGEASKSLSCVRDIYEALIAGGVTRSDVLIALGGGVVGDVGGFAAATYLRGIRCVQLPTTLLAQVDSAIGGKTGVDLAGGKNLVGCFHQPALVVIDPDALQTLPESEFLSGMGEVIKYALTFDQEMCAQLLAPDARAQIDQLILQSVKFKKALVEEDERDTGERMLLNFGHTLGHAIEAAQAFSGYSHGQAVAIGMCLITHLSEAANLSAPGTAQAVEDLVRRWHLPTSCPAPLLTGMRAALPLDKKNLNGRMNAVVLTKVGAGKIVAVPPDFFEKVFMWLR